MMGVSVCGDERYFEPGGRTSISERSAAVVICTGLLERVDHPPARADLLSRLLFIYYLICLFIWENGIEVTRERRHSSFYFEAR